MKHTFQLGFVLFFAAAAFDARAGNVSSSNKSPEVKSPPLPPIRSLKVEPTAVTLEDGLDSRKVLVWGETDAKTRIDLTTQASLKTDSPNIEIDSDGFVVPKKKGDAHEKDCDHEKRSGSARRAWPTHGSWRSPSSSRTPHTR